MFDKYNNCLAFRDDEILDMPLLQFDIIEVNCDRREGKPNANDVDGGANAEDVLVARMAAVNKSAAHRIIIEQRPVMQLFLFIVVIAFI